MFDLPMPVPPVPIRPASPEDAAAVARIDAAAGLSGWSASSYQETGFQAGSDFRVAESDGRVVAFCLALQAADDLEIIRIAVEPAEQGKGIAKALLAACVKEARDRGCARCFLEVRESNGPAVCLYLELGFILVGRRRNYYSRPVEDALVMELKLA